MYVCGNDDDDDGARVIHVHYRSDKGEKKTLGDTRADPSVCI